MSKPAPIPKCDHADCRKDGNFGERKDGLQRHWCRQHLPDGFLPLKQPAKQGALL